MKCRGLLCATGHSHLLSGCSLAVTNCSCRPVGLNAPPRFYASVAAGASTLGAVNSTMAMGAASPARKPILVTRV